MKKGKGKEKKSRVVAEQYENDGGSSDDEMPEVVSNATMKDNHDIVLKQLDHLKQQLRQKEKAKRRQKQEMFIAQKKTKLANATEEATEEEEKLIEDSANTEEVVTDSSSKSKPQPAKPIKKVYSSLNITVEPLTKVHNTRASAALDFKSKRLAKVPRESVKTAVISYQKKLQSRK